MFASSTITLFAPTPTGGVAAKNKIRAAIKEIPENEDDSIVVKTSEETSRRISVRLSDR